MPHHFCLDDSRTGCFLPAQLSAQLDKALQQRTRLEAAYPLLSDAPAPLQQHSESTRATNAGDRPAHETERMTGDEDDTSDHEEDEEEDDQDTAPHVRQPAAPTQPQHRTLELEQRQHGPPATAGPSVFRAPASRMYTGRQNYTLQHPASSQPSMVSLPMPLYSMSGSTLSVGYSPQLVEYSLQLNQRELAAKHNRFCQQYARLCAHYQRATARVAVGADPVWTHSAAAPPPGLHRHAA